MSTNFYYRHQGDTDYSEDNHIGLSTGAYFLMQADPKRRLTTHAAWLRLLLTPDVEIVDEYNVVWPLNEFFQLLDRAKAQATGNVYANSPVLAAGARIEPGMRYRDEEGHLFANYVFS